ncbi:hypothetical protein [Erythrobacter phage vB_EliS-L02]|nr:hypothetical protein [Erythrobacter phage vB_EliS-L02]
MTIRRNLNVGEIAEDYNNFRTAMDEAPSGLFEATRAMFRSLDDGVGDLLKGFDADGLVYDNCDQIFEIEALLFDMLRRKNPILQSEIASAIGLGETLSTASREVRERVLAGLERDRDFLASLKKAEMA